MGDKAKKTNPKFLVLESVQKWCDDAYFFYYHIFVIRMAEPKIFDINLKTISFVVEVNFVLKSSFILTHEMVN